MNPKIKTWQVTALSNSGTNLVHEKALVVCKWKAWEKKMWIVGILTQVPTCVS